MPETNHKYVMFCAGRGFGKTLAGAGNTIIFALCNPNTRASITAPTHNDLLRVCLEGESGLLGLLPPELINSYNKSTQIIDLYNGTRIEGFSGEKPDRMRGPQYHWNWTDELAAMPYQQDVFDQTNFGLRLGKNPKMIITTTPRPTKLIKELIKEAYVIRGSTYDNKNNLPESFLKSIEDKYANTRLGRQEINAEILEDVEGALWQYNLIKYQEPPDLKRVVVAIDPAVTANKNSDETGIVVVGHGIDDNFYVLEDYSCRVSPNEWAERAINAYHQHDADAIIAEVNNGGDLVKTIIKQKSPTINYRDVRASRGKIARAEPIAALYEQGKVFHVKPLAALEEQMISYTPATAQSSPDRLDALVWALSELAGKNIIPQNFEFKKPSAKMFDDFSGNNIPW